MTNFILPLPFSPAERCGGCCLTRFSPETWQTCKLEECRIGNLPCKQNVSGGGAVRLTFRRSERRNVYKYQIWQNTIVHATHIQTGTGLWVLSRLRRQEIVCEEKTVSQSVIGSYLTQDPGGPGGARGPEVPGLHRPADHAITGALLSWSCMHFCQRNLPLTLSAILALQIFTLLHMLPPHFSSQETRRIPNPNKSNAKLRLQPVFQLTEPSFSVQFSSSIPRNFAEKLENFQCAEFSQFLSEETLNCSPQFQPNFCPSIEPTWLKWLESMQLQAVTFRIDGNNITSFFDRTILFRFLVWMTCSMMLEIWLDSLAGLSETEGDLLSNLKLLLR